MHHHSCLILLQIKNYYTWKAILLSIYVFSKRLKLIAQTYLIFWATLQLVETYPACLECPFWKHFITCRENDIFKQSFTGLMFLSRLCNRKLNSSDKSRKFAPFFYKIENTLRFWNLSQFRLLKLWELMLSFNIDIFLYLEGFLYSYLRQNYKKSNTCSYLFNGGSNKRDIFPTFLLPW